jgi:7-carboxy-7-deazaguanine synthase
MSKLVTVQEGIFPITCDHQGQPINELPRTGLSIAGTIQGEGKLAGIPSLFIRLAACNLRCMWYLPDGSLSKCDTPYSSFNPGKTLTWESDQIISTISQNLGNISHVVITGGEPLLQKTTLKTLIPTLKKQTGIHITIETNGTLFDAVVAQHTNLVSLSPKLRNSDPTPEKMALSAIQSSGPFTYHAEKRRNIEAIQQWIDHAHTNGNDFQLKFVIGRDEDEKEIKNEFLSHLNGWKPSDILVMPLGASHEQLNITTPIALKMAIANGWRYAPRLHIDLFGNISGV